MVLVFHNFDVGNLVSKSLRESLENSLFFCLLPIIIVIIQFQVQSISTYPHALFVPFINWMPLIAMMSIRTDLRSQMLLLICHDFSICSRKSTYHAFQDNPNIVCPIDLWVTFNSFVIFFIDPGILNFLHWLRNSENFLTKWDVCLQEFASMQTELSLEFQTGVFFTGFY